MKSKHARADSELSNLWWRPRADGVEVAYIRQRVAGRDTWKSLGIVEPRVARDLVRAELRARGNESLMIKLGVGVETKRLSTVGEVIEAYRKFWAGTRKDPQTGENNISRLMQLLKAGGGAGERDSISAWCADTVRAFETSKVQKVRARAVAERWDAEMLEVRMTSAMRSVWGVFRQAKSIFSREALASAQFRALILPEDLDATTRLRVGDRSMPEYSRPAAAVVAAVMEGIAGLRSADPAMFLAAMMEILTGARVGTAAEAKWSWFVAHGAVDATSGRPLVAFEIRLAKGGLSVVQLYMEDVEQLRAARVGGGDFIVPGTDATARREVFTRLQAWLRLRGLDRRQPNHELRKLFADTVNKIHGWEKASNLLGHSDLKLKKHYAEAGAIAPISLSDILIPARNA